MARSRSMQVLTNQIKERWPGVVVYGIGDDDHQDSPSGHNEDDTPGSRPDQEDADNVPEHRAIDVMLGSRFSRDDAYRLVGWLVSHPENRIRLTYVIFDGSIWSAKTGFQKRAFGGDPHRTHPHINGKASDDENGSPWILDVPTVPKGDEDMKMIIGTLNGRATAWSGLRGLVPLHAHSHGESVEALVAAGAITRTFKTAEALVEALGGYEDQDTSAAIADVKRAG
jgi:hypothetical protein